MGRVTMFITEREPRLTARHREALRYSYLHTLESAKLLGITVRGVYQIWNSIKLKLGARSKEEAIKIALDRGIISREEFI